MADIPFDRPADSLYAQLPLRHVSVLPVLGIPVRFESNSPAVMDAVQASFGAWRALQPDETPPGSRVQIVVHDAGPPDAAGLTAISYRRPEPGRMMFVAAGSTGTADVTRRDALAYVTPALVATGAHFRYGVVEALTLFLLTGADRFPVHASAVMSGDTAILLCGSSGSGKSTLAYAAARHAGVELLSDDVVYVQREPHFRVWGNPGPVHLSADARSFFPELAGHPETLLANGKRKLAVPVTRGEATGRFARRAIPCVLDRHAGTAGLYRLTSQDVVDALTGNLEPGFDVFGDSGRAAIEHLAADGGWRIASPAGPGDAVDQIRRIVASAVTATAER